MTTRARAAKRPRLIGIDLGTSFSSICWLDGTFEARPIENKEGEYKTPSAVYFVEDGGGPIVGRVAFDLGAKSPERLVIHAKRYLGDPEKTWEIDGVIYTPVDIAAFVIRKLIGDAESKLGPIREAVVAVPAHFNDLQRRLTIEAARQAGLESVQILNEPVAAALSFILGSGGREMLYLRDNSTVLIFDLGGGTFDLSLVRFDDRQLRVLATNGELALGGLDWDQTLVDLYAEKFIPISGIDIRELRYSKTKLRLWQKVEAAKRRLSDPNLKKTLVSFRYQGHEADYELVRDEFEDLTRHLVARTKVLTNDLVRMADVTWDAIDTIVPVGGSTRMLMIDALLEEFASKGPERYKLNPDLAVSTGAALYAGILQGDDFTDFVMEHPRARALAGYSATVVNSKSLAILVRDNRGRLIPHVLIPRNTPLPATASVAVTTSHPNQSVASLKIVECDDETGRSEAIVCKCNLYDLPPNLPEGSAFDVEVSYDTQGLLRVNAKHRESGRLASISAIHQAARSEVQPVLQPQPGSPPPSGATAATPGREAHT
jgi:molecular chaperone DnaK